MEFDQELNNVRAYFDTTLKHHGTTARGVDWNSDEARAARFEQLMKIVPPGKPYTLLDYGSGYGALAGYLIDQGSPLSTYYGYDIVEAMAAEGQRLYTDAGRFHFVTDLADVPVVEYATACGVFNMKLDTPYDIWTTFVLKCLHEMDEHCTHGFSVNFLTRYSDPERMRSDLYYADPGYLFDYCKTHFARNVALLHDYNLFDFTLLVRKTP